MEAYITVNSSAREEIIEKRSRFIASVYPVKEEAEAIALINSLKKEFWDARHNVYAYSLRSGNICRYSDDGEPSGTAGVPVLDVLRKQNITDCLIVVTRYFGGILLGTGGLVRAYTASAVKGVAAAKVVKMLPCSLLSVTCPYSDYDQLCRIIENLEGAVSDTRYGEFIEIDFTLDDSLIDRFSDTLRETFCARLSFEIIGNDYQAKDI